MAIVTADAIKAKFPHKQLTLIIYEPNYISLRKLHQQVYGNASSVYSQLGGGNNGCLGAVMPDAKYFNKTGHYFIIPAHPGAYDATIIGNASNVARARAEAEHNEIIKDHETATIVRRLLTNQIVAAVDKAYIDELNDNDVGFLQVTPEDLLDHLFDRYGLITEHMITVNKAKIDEPFDPSLPFSAYTRRIEQCLQLAEDANTAYTDSQLVQIGEVAMAKCGMFPKGYRRWMVKPAAKKTWNNFKTHFNAEHATWRNLSKMSAKDAGYSANSATTDDSPMKKFLAQMANAATTDKSTFEKLANTIETQQKEIKALQEDNRRLHKIIEHAFTSINMRGRN